MSVDIAATVRSWQDRVTAITKNLSELNDAEFVRQIRFKLRTTGELAYTGGSRVEALRAVGLLDTLWDNYLSMATAVDHALDLLKKKSLFTDPTAAIEAWLGTPCVVLGTEAVPLEQRGLTGTAEVSREATLEEAQRAMEALFAEARRLLLRLRDAEAGYAARVLALTQDQDALATWAATLGEPAPALPAIAVCAPASDPLAAARQLDALDQSVAQVRAGLQTCEQARGTVRTALDEAHSRLHQLEELAQRNHQAVTESRTLLADPGNFALPISEAALASLRAWLVTLEEAYRAVPSKLKAAHIGTLKCRESLDLALQQEQAHYARNRAGLDEYSDLDGRLSAYRAKARALRARGVILSDTLDELKEQAKICLAHRPVDLTQARRLVQSYEIALSAASLRR